MVVSVCWLALKSIVIAVGQLKIGRHSREKRKYDCCYLSTELNQLMTRLLLLLRRGLHMEFGDLSDSSLVLMWSSSKPERVSR